ncbi:hypothetical protein BDM02DRAFT_3125846 [Thelephora ganbajun]|uniref:Uncharacterized protein n=1 Tax=Thelephora ganbajun TaxID=370292 RepID=A0ACB6ZVL6_THEGA|nr:hypothetical protein BDM02DRAFT_3125846 [Thelephora ganbajun]
MDQQALAKLIDSAPALIATRYFALTGCVVLLWDHLLTFRDEIEYIWKRPVELNKVVFLFNRYFVEGSLCYSAYAYGRSYPRITVLLELRGPLSQEMYVEQTSLKLHTPETFPDVTTIYYSLRALQSLQSRSPTRTIITYALLAGFFVTYGVTIVCAGLVVNDLQSHIRWVPIIKSCVVPHKPMPLIGVWAGMVTFDIFILVMMFANAVNRPYRENSEVVRSLHRDGIKFFTVLLFIRFINLVLTIFSNPGEILVIVFFLWAIVSVTLSRLLLMVKAIEKNGGREPVTPATTTTLWRNNSGYWSRKSDLIELKVAQ